MLRRRRSGRDESVDTARTTSPEPVTSGPAPISGILPTPAMSPDTGGEAGLHTPPHSISPSSSTSDVRRRKSTLRPPSSESRGPLRSLSRSASSLPSLSPAPRPPPSNSSLLPLVLTFIIPFASFVSGADFLKDVTLLLLLLFYLHQVIKVPWDLYVSSRPRYKTAGLESSTIKGNQSHLHILELIYLGLAVVSPLVGGILLRSVTSSLKLGLSRDHKPLSWFSTTLFALIAGLRPWTHLVERLQGHTDGLHDVIGEAIAAETAIPTEVLEEEQNAELEALQESVDLLENTNEELNSSVNLLEERIWKLERGRERDRKRLEQLETQVQYLTTLVQSDRRVHPDVPSITPPSFPTNPLLHPMLYLTAIFSFFFHFLMAPIAIFLPRPKLVEHKPRQRTVQFELKRLATVPEESEDEEDVSTSPQGTSSKQEGPDSVDTDMSTSETDSLASDDTAKPSEAPHPSHSGFLHIVFVTPATLAVNFVQGVLKHGF